MSIFSDDELKRYNRHIILPEIGLVGQQKLKNGSVLLIGAGGLGSMAALYLAASGVGKIGIVDFDVVDEGNLHRQVLYGTNQVGKLKLASARSRLKETNPHVTIETYETPLTPANAIEILDDYDVVLDCSDHVPTHYLISDACVLTRKPLVFASIYKFAGQLTIFNHNKGPCYRCFEPVPPPPEKMPSCAEGGVFGVLPGVIGSLQATEAIKLLAGIGESISTRLLSYNALNLEFTEKKIEHDKDCLVCGEKASIHELIDYNKFCGIEASEVTNKPALADNEIDVFALKERRDHGDNFILLDVREEFEYEISHINGSILIPLSTLENRITELSKDDDYVVMCKVGGRSARAVEFLESHGFPRVKNLIGGINEWTAEIDTSLAPY